MNKSILLHGHEKVLNGHKLLTGLIEMIMTYTILNSYENMHVTHILLGHK